MSFNCPAVMTEFAGQFLFFRRTLAAAVCFRLLWSEELGANDKEKRALAKSDRNGYNILRM